jgi:hypothetical protein
MIDRPPTYMKGKGPQRSRLARPKREPKKPGRRHKQKEEGIEIPLPASTAAAAPSFNAREAKAYMGAKIYITLKEFVEDKFNDFFYSLTPAQQLRVLEFFTTTWFPKEIKVEQEDPLADWTEEEMQDYLDRGVKPQGKVIYVDK